MKIALAQIDMRLGDIEGLCARTLDVAKLASEQGARLLCLPSPLVDGTIPGTLFEYGNFEHELVVNLRDLASRVEPLNITCLVPALLSYEGVPYFEAFVLRQGRVIPVRTLLAQQRGRVGADPWTPPVFDVGDLRIALTFDLQRDLEQLGRGCDLVLYFQVEGFDVTRERTAAAASVPHGGFAEEARSLGSWLACMAPVGGYEDAVFTGGSFVMDDAGELVAASPSFEEDLLVCDVARGLSNSCEPAETAAFVPEEWLWEALRLHLRDTVRARGMGRVVVPLDGDLPSSLLAALAVDAFGSRNVIGVSCERAEVFTPAQLACEEDRMACVRDVAASLRMRLIERSAGEVSRWMDRDVPVRDVPRLRARIDALYVDDVAHEMGAVALSPITKTAAALAPSLAAGTSALVAPFGDVYVTELEFLARYRNGVSHVLPARVVSLNAVEDSMASILAAALDGSFAGEGEYAQRAAQLLGGLQAAQVDGVLAAHVDRNAGLEETPLFDTSPETCALLLMLVRRAETGRRLLPSSPIVSARSFVERSWPAMLAWSDMGRHGVEAARVTDLVDEEVSYSSRLGAENGERMRSELLGMLGSLLGLSEEQTSELASEDGQRKMREEFERFEKHMRRVMENGQAGTDASAGGGQQHGPMMPGTPFFSQN